MADPLFYKYYDEIYSEKDYGSEVETVLNICKKIRGKLPSSVLDVGCGTGNHSCSFSLKGSRVVGADLDGQAIEIAQGKAGRLPGNKPEFLCMDISALPHTGFDLAVSLFNVVSYIDDIGYLNTFFRAIHERLIQSGLFIFDCWNGIAAMLDPPKIKETSISVHGRTFEITTLPVIDLMAQTVEVSNCVKVFSENGGQEEFRYNYRQFLWPPAILSKILEDAGFEIFAISPAMQPEMKAESSTWKIMFICTLKNGGLL